jgi:hypothetical protein
MKVVCIKSDRNNKVTVGKTYDTININVILSQLNYYIEDDLGDKVLFDTRLFITLEEFREKRLKNLGIE